MTPKVTFGEYIRKLRSDSRLPLRKVAALLDVDPSTLSKIERNDRCGNKEMLPILAEFFKVDYDELKVLLLSDKVANELISEANPNEILEAAAEKIKYLKEKKLAQGSLNI
jgi:transcriptional regulator with XRE-family HTH domain